MVAKQERFIPSWPELPALGLAGRKRSFISSPVELQDRVS
jgi:hypothetical protein